MILPDLINSVLNFLWKKGKQYMVWLGKNFTEDVTDTLSCSILVIPVEQSNYCDLNHGFIAIQRFYCKPPTYLNNPEGTKMCCDVARPLEALWRLLLLVGSYFLLLSTGCLRFSLKVQLMQVRAIKCLLSQGYAEVLLALQGCFWKSSPRNEEAQHIAISPFSLANGAWFSGHFLFLRLILNNLPR